jgi:tetratricopeptide (TPR) repeat protein
MRAAIIAALTTLVLSAGAPARAQPHPKTPADEAKEQYERGIVAYNLEHFDEAIADFTRAYQLDPAPTLLFNIAQARWKKGENERAIFYYRRYLEAAPDAENRARVEARIHELETARSTPAPPPPPMAAPIVAVTSTAAPAPALVVQATEAPPPPRFYRRAWFWGVVGAVVIASVATTLALTSSKGPGSACADCKLGMISVPRP